MILKYILYIVIFSLSAYNLQASIFNYKININTESAKDDAIKDARTIALNNVIKKITTLNSFKKIDSLITSNNSYLFETSFQIQNESIGNNKYFATLLFNFNSVEILNFLEKNKIPYVKSFNDRSLYSKYLIIPEYIDTIEFGDSKEKWDLLWKESSNNTFFSQFIYSSVTLDFTKNNNIDKIKLQGEYNDIIKLTLTKLQNNLYSLTLQSSSLNTVISKDIDSLNEAFNLAVFYIEDSVKLANIEHNLTANTDSTVLIATSDIKKYNKIMSSLSKVPDIKQINVVEININFVFVNLKHKNSLFALQQQLVKQCINLNSANLELTYCE